MAKKKKKEKKTPKIGRWDVFRIMRKLMKRLNKKIIFGTLAGLFAAGGLVAFFRGRKKTSGSKYYRSILLGLAVFCGIMAFYGIYSVAYAGKSFPNVKLADMKVGGKTNADLKKSLDEKFRIYEIKQIKFNYKDKNWQLNPSDIKLSYDSKKTEDRVISIGREKTFFGRMWSRLGLIGKAREVKPIYTYDKVAFGAFIDKIATEVDVPELDATGVIKKNNVTFVADRTGMRVEKVKLQSSILSSFDSFTNPKISVPVATSHPNVTLGDTEMARQQVMTMLKSKLNLKWQKGAWNVGSDVFSSWVKFRSEKVDGQKTSYRLTAYISDEEVTDYLKKLSKDIDVQPQNAKLAMNNGQLTVAQVSVTGYAFDPAASISLIRDGITSGETREIQLAVKEVQPDVTSNNYLNLGIKEIVGTGATNFKGSSDARKANVANGARIVSGTLIKPGGEFSAVGTIGNVDASAGFVLGLVIKGTKTVPEYGGGLCQVSSTLFRAALYSGLRVTERANHAYRVGYYETDGDGKRIGPGLDSTIYGPHPDLRFVNDTGNWILIQGRIEKTKLTFDFWGTKDGRVATVSAPVISNEIPAPAAEYINTDTLFVGQTEQSETSHPGALVVFDYSVMKDGKEINKQTFKSKYKPWGAKYLVGTKPVEVAPAPAPAPIVPVTPVATPVVEVPAVPVQ